MGELLAELKGLVLKRLPVFKTACAFSTLVTDFPVLVMGPVLSVNGSVASKFVCPLPTMGFVPS